ncbi:hypothetical protein H6P81_007024 [Aristolochia fimbriata]|uniref:Nucleotide-diphospho-sugar transferase n=1 Tax=Aristolochia fimbriata TaxID=158543 RepID=A0AAV7F153_ARIFI|nr:hypothetical protein H6P81_007024 [Aristolochia fimbriata]
MGGISRGWRPLLFTLPLLVLIPFLFSVSELHQSQKSINMAKKRSTKYDHLVLGEPAGVGLPNRLQCQGLKALNKTQFSSSSHRLKSRDKVSVVTVFAVYNRSQSLKFGDKATDTVTVGNSSYNKLEKSMAILNVFINFIQVSMPQSSVIILSDPASDLSLHRDYVRLIPIQGDYSREKLMLQRIRSYIGFLGARYEEISQQANHVNHFVFTDSDMAVVDDLGSLFNTYSDFDLALTFRNNKDQPLNSGFIAVRGTSDGILKARNFLQEVLEVYRTKFIKASRMLGDQMALAWVVKSYSSFATKRFNRPEPFIDKVHGVSVLFLPCAVYNWTPPEGAGQFHGMPLDVKVVHFKGSRKRLMLESWNYFNSSGASDFSDMLCLVLKSGRTKYDF